MSTVTLPHPSYIATTPDAFDMLNKVVEDLQDRVRQQDAEIIRLINESFKQSVVFEQLKKRFFDILADYEAGERWKDSLEHCIDYIDHAQFAERCFNRTANDIAVAQEWFKKNR